MARKGLNIYKRKDGRWEARYIKSRNTQGKPQYGYLYATSYHEVRNNLQKVIQVLNATDNEKVPATNYKFMDFSVIWLENSLSSLKESTYKQRTSACGCCFTERLGKQKCHHSFSLTEFPLYHGSGSEKPQNRQQYPNHLSPQNSC